MRAQLTMLILVLSMTGSLAADFRKGAIMQVKPNSIWFEEAAKLTEWQKRRKSSSGAAFANYQRSVLSEREAWQFINPQTVKVLGYERGKNQVTVELKTTGRLQGSTWVLDAGAFQR
jgi:hypothetical protein